MMLRVLIFSLILSLTYNSYAEKLTLDQLYEMAIQAENSKTIQSIKRDYEIAHYNKLSSISNMAPKFSTSAQYMHWNKPTDISF